MGRFGFGELLINIDPAGGWTVRRSEDHYASILSFQITLVVGKVEALSIRRSRPGHIGPFRLDIGIGHAIFIDVSFPDGHSSAANVGPVDTCPLIVKK